MCRSETRLCETRSSWSCCCWQDHSQAVDSGDVPEQVPLSLICLDLLASVFQSGAFQLPLMTPSSRPVGFLKSSGPRSVRYSHTFNHHFYIWSRRPLWESWSEDVSEHRDVRRICAVRTVKLWWWNEPDDTDGGSFLCVCVCVCVCVCACLCVCERERDADDSRQTLKF